jgi:hypothetical protein
MKAKVNAKLAIRMAILTAVMVGTFLAASVQPIPVADGGPILLCPPKQPNCSSGMPPM